MYGDYFKYIVIRSMGLEVPVLFPALLSHADVAAGLGGTVSAGFVSFTGDGNNEYEVSCWGKASSIETNSKNGFASRPEEDAKLIKTELERPYR